MVHPRIEPPPAALVLSRPSQNHRILLPTTCDLFIWAKDMDMDIEAIDDGGNQTVADVVSLAIDVLEEGKKKNAKIQKNLNAKRFAGKIKLIFFIASLLLNFYFGMICGVKPKLCIGRL